MRSYIRYALASSPQSRDRLENRRGIDDKMSRGVWEEIENRKTDKARMAEARRKRRTKGKKRERKERRV